MTSSDDLNTATAIELRTKVNSAHLAPSQPPRLQHLGSMEAERVRAGTESRSSQREGGSRKMSHSTWKVCPSRHLQEGSLLLNIPTAMMRKLKAVKMSLRREDTTVMVAVTPWTLKPGYGFHAQHTWVRTLREKCDQSRQTYFFLERRSV